jgi:hypothetical protein
MLSPLNYVAFATFLALCSPASATSITVFGAGVLHTNNGDSEVTFDSIPSTTTYGNSGPVQGPFAANGANFSGSGILMLNGPGGAGGSLGLYAEPFHDTTQYLTVQPGGSTETIQFASAFQRFGLYWGSIDTYNSIAFFRGNTLLDTITGAIAAGAVPALAQGQQANDANNRYFVFTGIGDGLGFDKIVLTSTSNSFEVDNLSWGPAQGPSDTPLPSTLPLFISGGAMLGGLLYRRKRKAA